MIRVAPPQITPQRPTAGNALPIPMQLDPRNTTPVYGTAQPATGLTGQLRCQAYGVLPHHPMRWLLLLAADRVETGGALAREVVTPGRQGAVVRHFARQVRAHPVGYGIAAALVAGGLGAWLAGRGRVEG